MKMLRRPRRISIYVLLSLLILVLSAPMLLLFGRFVTESAAERRSEALERGLAVADQVTDALEREFQSLAAMLAVFASSGWIEDEEYGRLHLRARSALAGTDTNLIVLDENFDQILNTRTTFGPALGRTSDPETAQRAIETGRTVLSDLFHGRLADTTVFNMVRAAAFPDERSRVLILTRSAHSLQTVIDPSLVPAGWSYAIFDSRGQLVVGSYGSEPAGRPPDSCRRSTALPPADDLTDSTFTVVQSLTAWPWRVCAWAPYATVQAPVSASWRLFSIAAILVIAVSLVTAALLGRIIVGGTMRAAQVGRLLEEGNSINEQSSFIAEIDDVLHILRRAARERAAKEEELKLLLGETAHRAKNQIAIASSLVRLAAGSARDVGHLRDDLLSRFMALSRSVDMLVGRNWQTVSLSKLVAAQLNPFVAGQTERLEISGEDISILPTAAQSLGLVVNELATNASKYGAWSGEEGRVRVEWSRKGDTLLLSWTETRGPPAFEPPEAGFGTRLIENLIVRSFSGELSLRYEESGFTGTIQLPLDVVQARPTER